MHSVLGPIKRAYLVAVIFKQALPEKKSKPDFLHKVE